jgi:hypothetical protein
MAYGRAQYSRVPYARPGQALPRVTANAFLAGEALARLLGDAAVQVESRGVAPHGSAGAYGRAGYGRGAYGGGGLVPAGSGGRLTADARLSTEQAAGVVRWANAGAYPEVNAGSSLASGMVGAYFPGYGAPVIDATGTWNALAASTYGTAGTLTSIPGIGPAMEFNGVLNGLWHTGSGMPLVGATALTVACVCQVSGPATHVDGGAAFALTQSTNASNRLLLGWSLVNLSGQAPAGAGYFYFNPQMNASTATVYTPLQILPTGTAVLLITCDLVGLTCNCYLNGALIATQALGSGTSMSGFDTVSVGCRVTASQLMSNAYITSGSTTMTAPSSNEDDTVGSPLTDPDGYIPAGAYCTADSPKGTYTLSQAATNTESNFVVTWLGPFTRLMNGAVSMGVMWNRILSSAEIAAFSANPLTAFTFGEGAQLEVLGGVRGDQGLAGELLASRRADPGLPAESVGAASVIKNSFAPLESLAAARGDAATPIEGPANQRADAALPTASLGAMRADDAPLWPELLASALRDFGLPVDWTGAVSVVAEAFLRQEILLRQQADADAPIEWTGTLSAAVTAESGAPIEWVGVFHADRPVAAETLGDISVDMHAMVAELLVTARRGQTAPLEMLSIVQLEAGLQGETLGQALIVFDIGMPIESGAVLIGPDPIANLEASLSAVSETWIGPESGFTIPAMLLSVEQGRILAAPGRIRLLKAH